MSININAKDDYSYLFQGLSTSGSSLGNLNFLSDYASIKNGSYGKLLKAYYGTKNTTSSSSSDSAASTGGVLEQILYEKRNPTLSKETQEANANLSSGISSLTSAVSALQKTATYTDSEGKSDAQSKTVDAVKDYVSLYNDVVKTAKNSTLTNKTAYVAGMMRASEANADKLAEIGITVDSDGTLQLDESKLRAAGTDKVQELFSPDNIISYGSTVMSRLRFAGITADAAEEAGEEEEEKAYTGAAGLKDDIAKLTSEKLFETTKDKDGAERYDVDAIYDAMESFVGNYNSMLGTARSSANSGVLANLATLLEKTEQNRDALETFGISVDQKGKLTLDEEKFRNADMAQFQQFMKKYGSSIATNVSLINYYTTTQAGAANSYTAEGIYNVQGALRYDEMI